MKEEEDKLKLNEMRQGKSEREKKKGTKSFIHQSTFAPPIFLEGIPPPYATVAAAYALKAYPYTGI